MSDESEIGVVLENAPKMKKAFGANRGALITLVGLYLARRRTGIIGLVASVLAVLATGIQIWLYYWV
jgi:hypothetical protein